MLNRRRFTQKVASQSNQYFVVLTHNYATDGVGISKLQSKVIVLRASMQYNTNLTKKNLTKKHDSVTPDVFFKFLNFRISVLSNSPWY